MQVRHFSIVIGDYLIVATGRNRVGMIDSKEVFQLTSYKILPISTAKLQCTEQQVHNTAFITVAWRSSLFGVIGWNTRMWFSLLFLCVRFGLLVAALYEWYQRRTLETSTYLPLICGCDCFVYFNSCFYPLGQNQLNSIYLCFDLTPLALSSWNPL